MSKKDGMYFYYDWLGAFRKIPPEDFKDFVISMIEYHKEDKEPPEFEGIAGMAAEFIFPQIARSKTYAVNGARGGEASQRNAQTKGLTNGLTNGLRKKRGRYTLS